MKTEASLNRPEIKIFSLRNSSRFHRDSDSPRFKNFLFPALVIIFTFLFFMCVELFADVINVSSAEIEWHKYYDNVFIQVSSDTNPKSKIEGNRLILSFADAKASAINTSLEKSPRIKKVYSRNINGASQIVIELKKPVKYEVASILGKGQIAVEIAEDKNSIPMVSYNIPEEANIPEKVVSSAISGGIKTNVLAPIKTKSEKQKKSLAGKVIVIDPGHGGADPGAKGYDGTYEKDLTLKTSKYIAGYLTSKGARVFLTRTTDVKKELCDIVAFANRINADIYIAVHFNSIEKGKISGTETYYYTPQSFRLASLLHKRMLLLLRRQDEGVKRAKFYTISKANMPAVLVEPIYISDMQESILARSKTLQKEIAKAVVLGVEDYFTR